MKKTLLTIIALAFAGAAYGQTFTDINSPQYEGKTNDKKRNAAIDANFALIESGATINLSANNLTGDGAFTWIGASVTSRWDDASSKIDGEQIADDTIDDDSIDFADVTGADLTLTDCGAITSSGAVQGTTLALSATQWFDVINTTQLVFIADGVTNVIDADITTP